MFFLEELSSFTIDADKTEAWRAWQLVEAYCHRAWQQEDPSEVAAMTGPLAQLIEAQDFLLHCGPHEQCRRMLIELLRRTITTLVKEQAALVVTSRDATSVKAALLSSQRRMASLCAFLSATVPAGAGLNVQVQQLCQEVFYHELCATTGVGLAAVTLVPASVPQLRALVAGGAGAAELPAADGKTRRSAISGQAIEEGIDTFVAITGASRSTAGVLLRKCRHELDAAVTLFFESPPPEADVGKEGVGDDAEGLARRQTDQGSSGSAGAQFFLPDNLVARVLCSLPASLLAVATAACSSFRKLLPEATALRAAHLGVHLPRDVWGEQVTSDFEGQLGWLRSPCPAWRCTWPLRIIEALAVSEAIGLWELQQPLASRYWEIRSRGAAGTVPDSSASLAANNPGELAFFRAYSESILGRGADADGVLLRAVLRARGRRILQALVGTEAALARAMVEKGALGPQPALLLLPDMLNVASKTAWFRKPDSYDRMMGRHHDQMEVDSGSGWEQGVRADTPM